MNIISFFEATVTVGSSWEEIRPLNGIAPNAVLNALAERYQFQTLGFSQAAQQVNLFLPSLQVGEFNKDGNVVNINSLEFQPNFFLASGSVTDDVELFIKDVLTFLEEGFGFRSAPVVRKRAYRSTIISDLGFPVSNILGRWTSLSKTIENMVGDGISVVPFGIKLMAEKPEVGLSAPIIFERRNGAPEGEDWLYSSVLLDSSAHAALLEEIAQTFA